MTREHAFNRLDRLLRISRSPRVQTGGRFYHLCRIINAHFDRMERAGLLPKINKEKFARAA